MHLKIYNKTSELIGENKVLIYYSKWSQIWNVVVILGI